MKLEEVLNKLSFVAQFRFGTTEHELPEVGSEP